MVSAQSALISLGVLLVSLVTLPRCGKKCDAPALNLNRLESVKRSVYGTGPRGYLIVPNPIEATKNLQATISDLKTTEAYDAFHLPGLLDQSRLENNFIKVRVQEWNDPISSLATANAQGEFGFAIEDPRYSEVMAYHSVYTIQDYVESLGFSVVQSRPLYIMVRAKTENPDEVNALYDHNYLNPSLPRTMRLFGNTPFAPGMDRDMYWHEFGHLFNESVSREVGIDLAADYGAVFTEGSALHECLADLRNNLVTEQPTIGRWLARNIAGISPGAPLRYAVDRNDGKSQFRSVILADGSGTNPERYTVAEWCTRVLWEIRDNVVKQNPQDGNALADRLIFSAASLLPRDASLQQFMQALKQADEELHCGEYSDGIEAAFERRGFVEEPEELSRPLQLVAEPVRLRVSQRSQGFFQPTSLGFRITVTNPNSETARNVRVKLESLDPNLHVLTYQQGYGDLPPGSALNIGERLGFDFSVSAEIDRATPQGKRLGYRIRVFSDNGGEKVLEGQVQP